MIFGRNLIFLYLPRLILIIILLSTMKLFLRKSILKFESTKLKWLTALWLSWELMWGSPQVYLQSMWRALSKFILLSLWLGRVKCFCTHQCWWSNLTYSCFTPETLWDTFVWAAWHEVYGWGFIWNELFLYKIYQYLFWKAAFENVYFSKYAELKMHDIKFNVIKISVCCKQEFNQKTWPEDKLGRCLIL